MTIESTPPIQTQPVVMIVDDNETNLMIFKAFMQYFDCEILLARDGRKAVQLFEKNEIDLILMDVMMPEMDGLEATKKIRRCEREDKRNQTPIIAVTAHIEPADQHICINSGMNDYISKPVKSKTLIDAIKLWRPSMSMNANSAVNA